MEEEGEDAASHMDFGGREDVERAEEADWAEAEVEVAEVEVAEVLWVATEGANMEAKEEEVGSEEG